MSGGGGTSTFSGNSGGDRGGGASSSFSAGGVSIKGDSSIFSSMGNIGQGGATNVFSSGGGAPPPAASAAPMAPPQANGSRPRPVAPAAPPVPPIVEERPQQLDWLTQDSINSNSDYSTTNDYTETPVEYTQDYSSISSYDTDIGKEYIPPPQYESIDTNTAQEYDLSEERISQQYQSQGLDMFSGNQDGFGAVQGESKAGGDLSHRGSADDVKGEAGVVGSVGVTMGGDFGGSGGVSGRQSARYNQGGDYED